MWLDMALDRIKQVPLLVELFGLLEIMILSLIFVGRGFDIVIFVSEQHNMALSFLIEEISSLIFPFWLRPLTFREEIVIRFFWLDKVGGRLREGGVGV
jgi:hypothetical protein